MEPKPRSWPTNLSEPLDKYPSFHVGIRWLLFGVRLPRLKATTGALSIFWSGWAMSISLPSALSGMTIGALDLLLLNQYTTILIMYSVCVVLLLASVGQIWTAFFGPDCKQCIWIPVVVMVAWIWVAFFFVRANWRSTATPVYIFFVLIQFWVCWISRVELVSARNSGKRYR